MIGEKLVMATTGMVMMLFLAGHLVGNTLLFVGREEFNLYADFLNSFKMVYLVEAGLMLVLVAHVWSAIRLTLANKRARPVGYVIKRKAINSTWMSSHMAHTGVVILLFLIMHIASMKLGPWDNEKIKHADTLYDLVLKLFADPIYSGIYLVCMILLGFHLHHAMKSSFITLGVARKHRLDCYAKASLLYSLFISIGFSSFPVYFYILSII